MKIRFGLKFKNAVFQLSLFVITLGLIFFTVSETEKNSHYIYHLKYLNVIKDMFKHGLNKAMLKGEDIRETCQALIEMHNEVVPGFKGILLSDKEGIIFNSTKKSDQIDKMLKSTKSPVTYFYSGTVYLIENVSTYRIMWVFDLEGLENRNFIRQNPEFYFIGFLLLFFSLFISLFISEMLIKPIHKIVDFAKHVSSGNFHQNIEIDTADEIEELAESINLMKDSLREKITGLESINCFIEGIFDLSMSGIAVTDPSYQVIKYNSKIEQLLEIKIISNFDLKQYLNKNFITKSLNRKFHFDIDNFRTGEALEIIKRDETAREKVLLISASELRTESNELTGYIFNFEDITRIKIYQRTLQESDRMAVLGRLSARLTHEIKNPLATVNSLSQHLIEENDHLDSRERFELLQTVYNEIQRLGDILGDVSKWARQSNAGESENFSISVVMESIINLTSFDFRKRKIQFLYEPENSEDPVYIAGSSDRFKQVMFNIIWNAMDAFEHVTDRTQTVRLKYTTCEDMVQISISDNGDGITENELEKIFEPFYTTKAEGMGLGLAIVSDIVRSMGGRLSVKSIPSEGTEFCLEFNKVNQEVKHDGQ